MATDRLDQLDYYTLLGLEPGASADTVREAFHIFALKYHPDRHVGGSPEKLERAAQIFRRGSEAYQVLLDPQSRQLYDQGLSSGRLRHDSSSIELRSRRPTNAPPAVRAPKARPFAQKAEQAIRAKDWPTAKLNLMVALGHDPGNDELEARLSIVESELALGGLRKS